MGRSHLRHRQGCTVTVPTILNNTFVNGALSGTLTNASALVTMVGKAIVTKMSTNAMVSLPVYTTGNYIAAIRTPIRALA